MMSLTNTSFTIYLLPLYISSSSFGIWSHEERCFTKKWISCELRILIDLEPNKNVTLTHSLIYIYRERDILTLRNSSITYTEKAESSFL